MRSHRFGLPSLATLLIAVVLSGSAVPSAEAQAPAIDHSFLSFFQDSLTTEDSIPSGRDPEDTASCYARYPDSLLVSPFRKVFELWTSEAVTNGLDSGTYPGWTAAQIDTFANAILDADSTTSDDVFPRVWSYFCMSDAAAAEDSVNYVVRIGNVDSTFTKLQISLYNMWNFRCGGCSADNPNYCDPLAFHWPESDRVGSADENTVVYGINQWIENGCNIPGASYYPVSPQTAAKGGTFAHELQHVADAANLHKPLSDGIQRSEFLSTAAEYVGGVRWENHRRMRDINRGLYRKPTGSTNYALYRLFSAYLFGRFPGDPDSDTDDLVYKLIRYVPAGQSTPNSSLYGMGRVLARDFADSVAGVDANEKMGNLYHQFALARFADDSTGYAGGIYGFGASGVSPRTFGWFEWTDTCIERVRWMPPDVSCGTDLLASGPVTVSNWSDAVDTVHVNQSRPLVLDSFGSEYFILRADSTIFNQGQTLRVEVSSNGLLPANEMLKVGYIEYEDPTGNLFDQPLRRVVPNVAISSPEWHPSATVEIPSFGDTTRAVVLVISMVQSPLQTEWGATDQMAISVSYDLSIDTTRVPSETQYIQTAIDATSPGDVVFVAGQQFGAAYGEALVMKPGVRVIGVDDGNGLPVLNAGSDTVAVSFPADATTSTTLENFTIRGGTEAIVHLRGLGRLKNCTLDGRATDPTYGIRADSTGAGAYVENCSVALDTGTGVYIHGLALDLTGCTIRIDDETSTNTGIEILAVEGASTMSYVDGDLVKVPNGTGIDNASGWTRLRNCTIDSVAVGVDSSSPAYQCIVSHHTTAGFDGRQAWACISSGTGYPYGEDDVALGEHCVAEDPLYCDSANGGYTLRADSYGAPDNNPLHALIGAFGVACLQDTIVRDMAYTLPESLPILGDIVIPTGMTLTLGANTTLAIANNDDRADLGSDAARVEIIVHGTLKTEGGLGEEAAFHAVAGGEGTWAGIRVMEDAFVKLDYASIENAVTGVIVDSVKCRAVQSNPQNYVTNSRFAANQSRDLKISGSGNCGGPPIILLVEGNTFTVGGGTGIEMVEDVLGVTVRGNTFVGSSTSTNGILLGSSSTSPVITENTASGFSNGYPLRIEGGSAEVTKNTFQNSKYGIYVYVNSGVASPEIGTTNSSSDNLLVSNTNGLRCEKTGAQPSVRNNQIRDNTYGVVTRGDANPFLGTAADHGNNSIHSNTTNCIRNLNTSVGLIAGGNWFGDCAEPGCGSGPVLFPDWLCNQPASFRRPGVTIQETTRRFVLRGAAPNPMSRSGAIVLELGQPANSVSIEIFDVAGRLVRHIETGNLGSGLHSLPWDGRDANGILVSSGLYFIRARTDGWDFKTAKMLVVR